MGVWRAQVYRLRASSYGVKYRLQASSYECIRDFLRCRSQPAGDGGWCAPGYRLQASSYGEVDAGIGSSIALNCRYFTTMTLSIAPLNASLVAQTMPTGPVSIATALANVASFRSGTIAIQDTADNIALNLDALQKVNTRISGVTFSGSSSTLNLSTRQIGADAAVLSKLNNGNYSLTAQSALVSDVNSLMLNAHVTAIELQDSSRNIAASLNALSASSVAAKVTSIRQTGTPTALAISAAQLLDASKAATLNKITDNYTLNVSGVSLADMGTVSDNSKVSGISILDSTSQIAAHLDDLRLS